MLADDTAAHGSSDVRASQRDRRIAFGFVSALAARGLVIGVTVLSVPIAVSYLGLERYGVWVALTSLSSILVFGDFGIGSGLVNLISRAYATQDVQAARAAVTSAIALLTVALVIFAGLAIAAYFVVPWPRFFNVSGLTLASETRDGAGIVLVLIVTGIPIGFIERIRIGFQEINVNARWAIVGAIGSLGGLLIAAAVSAPLWALLLLTGSPPLLATVGNGIRLFFFDRPWLRASISLLSRRTTRELAQVGGMFFVLQLAAAVAYQADVLVAANVLGPSAAGVYSVTMRVFMLVPSLLGIALTVAWPAYAEAISSGDVDWVRKTLRRSLALSISVVSAASVALVVFGGGVIGLLTADQVHPPTELVVAMGLWAIIYATFNCFAFLMNAASVVRFQVLIAVTMAGGSVTASYVLAHYLGLVGIVSGTVITYVVVAAIPIVLYLPRLMRRIESRRAAIVS